MVKHKCVIFHCRNDYLKITDANNKTIDVYCGYGTGQRVIVTGEYVVITFHSDYSFQGRFLLLFSFVPISTYSKRNNHVGDYF